MSKRGDDEIIVFSFLIGLLAFFSLRERRIDSIKNKISSQSSNNGLNKDWDNVRTDLHNAFEKIKKEYI